MKPAAAYLLLGAAAGVGAVQLFPGWPALPLVATAVAFVGAGAAYLRGAPAMWGKRPNGRLAPWAWVLFWPLLTLNWLLLLAAGGRGARAFSEIAPGVFLGRLPLLGDEPYLRSLGVRAVLDVTAEFPALPEVRALGYRSLPVLDGTAPSPEALREGATWLAARAAEGPVLVHCALGYQRSAAFAAAYLLATGQAPSLAAAEEALRAARPGVALTEGQRAALRSVH